jgi:hypothetical protein
MGDEASAAVVKGMPWELAGMDRKLGASILFQMTVCGSRMADRFRSCALWQVDSHMLCLKSLKVVGDAAAAELIVWLFPHDLPCVSHATAQHWLCS